MTTENDAHHAEAVAHVNALGILTGPVRQRAIEAREKQLREEAEAGRAAEAARADAAVERGRISAIIRAGTDTNRPRGAARLALLGPVSVEQAKAILPTLASDADAQEADLIVPGYVSFGTAAAQAERRRIGAILGHPAAQGRLKAACALALEGDEGVPVEAAAALLASLPTEAAKPRTPTIAERQAGRVEVGASFTPVRTKAEAAAEGWRKAAAAANASIGAGPAAPAAGGSSLTLPGPDEPGFATKSALDAAMAEARARIGGRA